MSATTVRARTTSVDQTRDLAAALAELARPGDLLVLVGDLGAGKTAFCQGFGRGLGVDEQITSPTFAIVQSYTGRLDLHHLDVYRLGQLNEAHDLGLNELLDEGGVTVIEWGDMIVPVLPPDFLEVHLDLDLDGDLDGETAATSDAALDVRNVRLVPVGARWSARVRAVRTALSAWSVDEPGSDPTC